VIMNSVHMCARIYIHPLYTWKRLGHKIIHSGLKVDDILTCDNNFYIKILFQVVTVIHFPKFYDHYIFAVLKFSFQSATQ
jgi:hypothetical protein